MKTAGVQVRCTKCRKWLDTQSFTSIQDAFGTWHHEKCETKEKEGISK